MADNLTTYHRKRDFRRTPEPEGGSREAGNGLQFVIQKHDATRLHYDFRLEHDGVLKSWAVPKEPSLNPKDRRLAVRTEDHPLEYAAFEGEIPEPEYGAGSVVIWDSGRWEPLADPDRGLADGKLDFELHGRRLEGRWTLVRMAQRGARKRPENWLLIKRSDSAQLKKSTAAPAKRKSTSKVKPTRKTAARARGRSRSNKRAAKASSADTPGARRGVLPAHPAPQLATLVNAAPRGADWIYEPKLDGYRLLCRVDRGRVALLTRRGRDWTDRFPHIVDAARSLPCKSALLDGEAVVFDGRGLTDFQRLQNAIADGDPAIVLVAFDLLHLDGWDLRGAPLIARKALLRELLHDTGSTLSYGEHVAERGDVFFHEACGLGLEGIVAKRASDPYRGTRTKSWLKVKCTKRQEFVIVGFTAPAGSRTGFGALLLGVRDNADAPLRFAGKVGTGFDELALTTLKTRLDALVARAPPIDPKPVPAAGRSGVHWVRPELVAEVSFTEWTSDGRLRHPVFNGLREDKASGDIVLERAANLSVGAARGAAPRSADAHAPARARARRAVTLTNPDKVLFPDPGITKRQLARYWEEVAAYALPWISDRPLSLYRCPEGYAGQCFYQKHIGVGVPEAVARVTVHEGEEPYAMVDGVGALLGLVQIGALELHTWGSRAEHLEQADVIVFDLDPAEDVKWSTVVDAALLLRGRLESLGLHAFLRLTGGKGLHLVVPVTPGPPWPAVKKFARAFATECAHDEPKRFTSSISKSRRGGKIFIDYLRNDREATSIASYSPRARAGAPVALPIEWEELDARAAAPPQFGVLDVPALLRRRERDPWEGFEAARSSLVN